jgi:hypothetical protein
MEKVGMYSIFNRVAIQFFQYGKKFLSKDKKIFKNRALFPSVTQ